MMKINSAFLLRVLLLGYFIPTMMSVIIYGGFSTNYSTNIFSKQAFEQQYSLGIYRYRVLGKFMLLQTYELVKAREFPNIVTSRALNVLDPHGDPQFYSAYFYMNTFFLCLTCILLFFIIYKRPLHMDFLTIDLPLLFMCFLMTISQYVVVPYDTLSYFFLAAAALLILHDNGSVLNLLALSIIVILATLTRETSILILSFYVAIHYKEILTKPTTIKLNQKQIAFFVLTACFIATYLGLRFALGFERAVYQNLYLLISTSIFSIMGMVFFASILLLVFLTKTVTKEMTVFFIASLPYTLSVLLVANPWEIRLWVPIIIILILLKILSAQQIAQNKNASSTMTAGTD